MQEILSTIREAVPNAVNLGDDADTTGAVCAQLAGACWGVAGIPPESLDGLARRDEIEGAARALTGPLRV
ncbi:MAG TPA: ADP-ribosylglycohydrolase family protein [Planctomycetaceae bacterium]|nr:ADP-ribosylglycohydrolase family protein [Planctomycetaceae bacterium]